MGFEGSHHIQAAPAHLQFWSNRHAELHGIKSQERQGSNEKDPAAAEADTSRLKNLSSQTDAKHLSAPSFADRERKCCLLCKRQFKSDAEINKHERLSQLHRDNLQNDEIRSKAMAKVAKMTHDSADDSGYRDRAKERRQAFNQPKQAAPPKHPNASSASPASDDTAETMPSKGAALLGKMGWATGTGLGAQGTGMLAPVATDMYVQGVGLGAHGGKVGDALDEGLRSTKGDYQGFVDKTKERAKERFDRLT